MGGRTVDDGRSGGADVRNQLDTRLAEARSELTRALGLEREREEQYREGDKGSPADRSREEGPTPGAPQRDAPDLGRGGPAMDGPERDAPSISFDR